MRPIDLCPMCGILQEMDVSGFTSISVDPAGNSVVLLTKVYHCAACCCFVRSEDVPVTQENLAGVYLDEEELHVEHPSANA